MPPNLYQLQSKRTKLLKKYLPKIDRLMQFQSNLNKTESKKSNIWWITSSLMKCYVNIKNISL